MDFHNYFTAGKKTEFPATVVLLFWGTVYVAVAQNKQKYSYATCF